MANKNFTKIQLFGFPDLERSAYRIKLAGSVSRRQEGDPLKPYSWAQENGRTKVLKPIPDAVRRELGRMYCRTQIHAIQPKPLTPQENMHTGLPFNPTMVKT